MYSRTSATVIAALLATSALILPEQASAQVNFNALRDLHHKQRKDASPTISLFEQMEFIQTAVDSIKGLIGTASSGNKMHTSTGDHVLQFLKKTNVGDFIACQTCWYGVGEISSLLK